MCQNYPYFGLQVKGECSCDYNYGQPSRKYPQVDSSECPEDPATGDFVGKAGINAIYQNNLYNGTGEKPPDEDLNVCEQWVDENCNKQNCEKWAHTGECQNSAPYMSEMCPGEEYCDPNHPFRFQGNCVAWDDPVCTDA